MNQVRTHSMNRLFYFFRRQSFNCRRPCIKGSFDIGKVYFIKQPLHGNMMESDVMMILDYQGNIIVSSYFSSHLYSFEHHCVLLVIRMTGAFVDRKSVV